MLAIALLASLFLSELAGYSHASMMAVDLGSEYLKVALIKPGRTPISIVVNEMTRRKSPALVGVVNGERLLGEEAFSLSVRYPDSIFTRVRDLLGKPASDPSLHQMLQAQNLPFKVVPHSPDRNTAAVQGKDGSVHSAEELMVSWCWGHNTCLRDFPRACRTRGRGPINCTSPRHCQCTGAHADHSMA
jgi:hypoxia up-regulated 1